MQPTVVRVNLAERSYDVVVTTADVPGLSAFARERLRGDRALVVTDENVRSHALSAAQTLGGVGLQTECLVLPPGEAQKSLQTASRLYDRLIEMSADRLTAVVAVGGGVIGDLAGFVAATFARGLPLLMVPTTLLAMVDSSVGGKVAINHPRAKNMIGAFHQPAGVWIDTSTLDTLPDREYRSGLAEVLKYGVILDPALFEFLEQQAEAVLVRDAASVRHIVARSCQLKADIVERDERETTGLRAVLNYGHTFAHALETVSGYGRWLHGEAVAIGMICASRLAELQQLISPGLTERQRRLLERFGLPVRPASCSIPSLLAAMRHDKKAMAGRMRFVLPRRLGDVAVFDDIDEDTVGKVLEELME